MPEPAPSSWEDSLIADIRAHDGRPSSGPLAGHPLMLMWSLGAKSGLERRSILTYSRDGDDYVVAGTKSGAPVDPFWVANLAAHPRARVEVANVTFDVEATVYREGPERDRLWDRHVAALPHFGKYEAQVAGHRTIPVARLRRIEG
jgi:deazaflavin-dependent oxidoreductase (nitroreductase family)